jgi:hypothetical protein
VEVVAIDVHARHQRDGARELRLVADLGHHPRVVVERARVVEDRSGDADRDVLSAGVVRPLGGQVADPGAPLGAKAPEIVDVAGGLHGGAAGRVLERDGEIAAVGARPTHARGDARAGGEVVVKAGPAVDDGVIVGAALDMNAAGLVLGARDEVDDAGEGARAVQERSRAADDLDPIDVVEVDAAVAADVRAVEQVVVQRLTVGEHEQPIAVVVGLAQAANTGRSVGVIVREVESADAAERLGDGGITEGAELLAVDDRDRARRVLDALCEAGGGGDLAQRGEAEIDELRLLALLHLDVALDGGVPAQAHADAARAHGDVLEHGRREAHRPSVDLDEGVALVGADDDRTRERAHRRGHARRLARDDGDLPRRRLEAVAREVKLVNARGNLEIARRAARGSGLLVVDVDRRSGRALDRDVHRADDALERDRHARLGPELGLDRAHDGGLVAFELDEDLILALGDAERARGSAARAEVFAIDVHRRSGRRGLDLDHGDVGRDAEDGRVEIADDLRIGLHREGVDVITVRVGVALELLERARDVEDDVLVGDEPVREEEVLERLAELALLVVLGGELEMQLGLVGEAVGAGGLLDEQRGSERQRDEGRRDATRPKSARFLGHFHGVGPPFSGSC